MDQNKFQRGERLWLSGREVTFVEYRRYAAPRIVAAVVRRADELETRVVPLWKLARDRVESLARANAVRY